MIKMVPADKTAMSSPVSLLRVFFFVFLSRIDEIDVNYIHIYIYIYIYIYVYKLVLQEYIGIIIKI